MAPVEREEYVLQVMASAVWYPGRGVRCKIARSGNVTRPITAHRSKMSFEIREPRDSTFDSPVLKPQLPFAVFIPFERGRGSNLASSESARNAGATVTMSSAPIPSEQSSVASTVRHAHPALRSPTALELLGGADFSFIAGTVSGTTKCLVGHPFDTIKTRMQTNPTFAGPLECLSKTLRLEGIRGLYKVPKPPTPTVS
jgi:hypothetical protein